MQLFRSEEVWHAMNNDNKQSINTNSEYVCQDMDNDARQRTNNASEEVCQDMMDKDARQRTNNASENVWGYTNKDARERMHVVSLNIPLHRIEKNTSLDTYCACNHVAMQSFGAACETNKHACACAVTAPGASNITRSEQSCFSCITSREAIARDVPRVSRSCSYCTTGCSSWQTDTSRTLSRTARVYARKCIQEAAERNQSGTPEPFKQDGIYVQGGIHAHDGIHANDGRLDFCDPRAHLVCEIQRKSAIEGQVLLRVECEEDVQEMIHGGVYVCVYVCL